MLQRLYLLLLLVFCCCSQENKNVNFIEKKENRIKKTKELILKPQSHFYCEKSEVWPDIDHMSDLRNTDSTSTKGENWSKEELFSLFSEHRQFNLENKCMSNIDSFDLDEIMKGEKFQVEITTEYFPEALINKHIIVYGENGFAIISHGHAKTY